MATSKERIDRLDMLVRLIPSSSHKHGCPDPALRIGSSNALFGQSAG